METTEKRAYGHPLRTLATTLAVALLTALLLASTALAAGDGGLGKGARPGKPTAKAPTGTITQAKPTFVWSRVRSATSYELRVYQGSTPLLRKGGITKRTWTCGKALPKTVNLSWKVRAWNANRACPWSGSLKFKIVSTPSAAKAFTAFGFVSPAATGVINETLHTVAVTVPYGTNVTALVAAFATTGVSVAVAGTPQVSGLTANNFTNPVTYTVAAVDGTTQAYTVTVTVAGSSAKALTAFGLVSPAAAGVIDESLHTVAMTVPYGTNVTALVATFTTTGASVAVAGTPQSAA